MAVVTVSDRRLLAAVHRWARTHGWCSQWSGWSDGYGTDSTIRVGWAEGVVQVSRREGRHGFPVWPTEYRVGSVVQAVDVLVALGVLPPFLSSAYGLADDKHREEIAQLDAEVNRLTAQLYYSRPYDPALGEAGVPL